MKVYEINGKHIFFDKESEEVIDLLNSIQVNASLFGYELYSHYGEGVTLKRETDSNTLPCHVMTFFKDTRTAAIGIYVNKNDKFDHISIGYEKSYKEGTASGNSKDKNNHIEVLKMIEAFF